MELKIPLVEGRLGTRELRTLAEAEADAERAEAQYEASWNGNDAAQAPRQAGDAPPLSPEDEETP